MENYIVSARKYRPSTFASVVGQKALCSTLRNAVATNRLAPAYLFCGPRAKIHGINPYKTENVQLVNGDTDARTRIETWNGISIVTSHNIDDKIAHVAAK